MAVLKDHKGKFGINFDENKQALNSISTITSKMLKNELAGYITKFIKNELRNETENTKPIENEEDSSADIEPAVATNNLLESVAEESAKDESKGKVMDSSTAEL